MNEFMPVLRNGKCGFDIWRTQALERRHRLVAHAIDGKHRDCVR